MRLVTLEFEGIGSFADPMTIDFEALGTAGLFLVEGPTGSGKSTILDAIVFALYGSTAGATSDLGRLDSHVRDRSRPPYVELVFEVGGARYQIRRSPKHQRDKRRGSGTTDDNGSVSLVRLAPDTCDISHRAREVGDWVIENIGLTKSQFAATIVLAQGEFATFLDANTEARAQILEKVFGTEFYKDVEDQLACMRRAAVTERKRAKEAVQETLHRCLGALGLDPGTEDVERIDTELRVLREALREAEERSAEADRAYAAALDQVREAEALARAQTRKRELLGRQATLAQRQEQVEQRRRAIAEHERAQPIAPVAEAWQAATRRECSTDDALRRALTQMSSCDLTHARASDLERLTLTIGELQAALVAERELPALQLAVDDAERHAVDTAASAAALLAEQQRLQAQLGHEREALNGLAAPGDELAALVLVREQAEAGLQTWAAVDRAQLELAEALQLQAAAVSQAQQASAALMAARHERDQDQAARLAAGLEDGRPCLVCGSCEHPDPAQFDSEVQREDLARLERDAVHALERQHECEQAVARGRGAVQALQQACKQDRVCLQEQLDSVQAQIIEQKAVEAAYVAARQALDEVRDRLDASGERLEPARAAAAAAEAVASRAGATLAAACELVQRARGTHAGVAERVAALQAQVDAIRDVITCTSAHEQAAHHAAAAHTVLLQTLTAAGFENLQRAEAAMLDRLDLDMFRADVDAHDREHGHLQEELAQVQNVDLTTIVDLPGLREQLASQQTQRAQANEAKGSIEYRLCEADPLRELLASRLRDRQRVLDRTDAVIRMADLATATRSEVVHRVKLSSFVLMRRFQSVVDAANDRLDAISEGRYQLVVETRGLDNRGLAGLDLLIADQRTERTRSAKSLSGGERFYVALALALGLADVVRSESGGVQLGTLFIDEGFGSLDADTLEEVIDMLEQVRSGQDRVIGLVSHVDLLKQRIDARISVRPDPHRAAVSTVVVHA